MSSCIQLSKLFVARTQLKTAIELWFANGDPVSIHTLACAAHQIIHDINRDNGGPDLTFDSRFIKAEKRKQWVARLRVEMNFFKHADNDPTSRIDFDPKVSEFFILMSIQGLMNFRLEGNMEETAFLRWFMLRNPDMLTDSGKRFVADRIPGGVSEISHLTRSQFYDAFCDAFNCLR